jgi:hypothetical protein
MSLGEIGGIAFLGVCAVGILWLIVEWLPGDTTR